MRYGWQVALLLGVTVAQAQAQMRTVSSGAGGHHVEPLVTSNPRNPNELVVAGMVVSDLASGIIPC